MGITDGSGEPEVSSPHRQSMAHYKPCEYDQEIVVIVSLDDQLLPGSVAYGIHIQVETEMDLSIFDQRYKNEETGCPAYHPKILLNVVLFAYSHGIVGSRRIEKLCRKHMTCLALACGYTPDHRTIAAFVSSMHTEILPLFCDILRVCEEQGLLGGTVFAVILTALAIGAGIIAKKTVEEATKDSYKAIKTRIKNKFAGRQEAQLALAKYEEKPKVWEEPLKAALIEVGADRDEEIIAMAKSFMEKVDPQQAAMGKYNVQITGDVQGLIQGDYAQVNMTFSDKSEEKK